VEICQNPNPYLFTFLYTLLVSNRKSRRTHLGAIRYDEMWEIGKQRIPNPSDLASPITHPASSYHTKERRSSGSSDMSLLISTVELEEQKSDKTFCRPFVRGLITGKGHGAPQNPWYVSLYNDI